MTYRIKNVHGQDPGAMIANTYESWSWWALDVDGTIVDSARCIYSHRDYASRYATQKEQKIKMRHCLWDHNLTGDD